MTCCNSAGRFCLSLIENDRVVSKNSKHFNQILSQAIASGLFQDPFVSSKLLLLSLSLSHSNANNLHFPHTLFSQIQNPNIFAWNFMFKAYSHSNTNSNSNTTSSPQQCISLYNLMRRRFGLFPDRHSFPFLFKACARLSLSHKGQELHSLTFKLGLQHNVFVQNALLSMYSFCGLLHNARQVFDEIPLSVRDVVSWNSMVSGCIQGRCYWDALKVFDEMLKCDVNARPDGVTLINALTACARIGFLDMGRKIHGLLVRNEFVLDVILGSSLVDMYAKCGQMEHARKVFDTIPDKNVVCWTCLIAGYAHSHLFKESIELFREMQAHGVTADAATIACVISSCGHSGALDQGRWVHTHCERSGIHFNLSANNALIDMYSKCGDIQRALKIFHALNLTERDVFSWTAMITGLAMNGLSDEALNLFSQMEMSGGIVKPNEVTFLGVLSACSHAGLVDKGFHYFNHMTQSYNLKPRIEHYGCMVDLLGRANLLAEAERFISAMPIQPDVVIWRSLLFASGSHGNIKLAEFSAKRIEELEPKKCGARVLLSNVYASASRWSDVKNMRKSMALQRIQKLPGCSFIEIDGVVHEFFVADNSHCQMDSIYETIIRINKVIQAEGFDPEI